MQSYASTSRKDHTLQKMRCVGLVSHVTEQAKALVRWFGKEPVGHAIFIRQYDDTNIAVAPSNMENLDETPQAGRQGRRRIAPLLGMLQHVCLRRANKYGDLHHTGTECIQLHTPSQVLPKVGLERLCRALIRQTYSLRVLKGQ